MNLVIAVILEGYEVSQDLCGRHPVSGWQGEPSSGGGGCLREGKRLERLKPFLRQLWLKHDPDHRMWGTKATCWVGAPFVQGHFLWAKP